MHCLNITALYLHYRCHVLAMRGVVGFITFGIVPPPCHIPCNIGVNLLNSKGYPVHTQAIFYIFQKPLKPAVRVVGATGFEPVTL